MNSTFKKKQSDLRDFEEFENKIVSLISDAMPNLHWVQTPATRDGNKDAISRISHTLLDDSFEAWLEVKFRKNPNVNIASRAFDSTLVSALDAENLRAIYFATNAKTNTSLQYRLNSFCNKALPNIKNISILDGEAIGLLKDKENKCLIENFVFEKIHIVNCVDYANHLLYDLKSISNGEFNYIVIPFFNPFIVCENENDFYYIMKDDVIIERYPLLNGWNFPSFLYYPSKKEINEGYISLYINYKKGVKKLDKKVTFNKLSTVKIYYSSGLEISTLIYGKYESVCKGQSKRSLGLISGGAGTGKTYMLDSICATWSRTHEIFPIQFNGLSSDWEKLDSLLHFIFGNEIGIPESKPASIDEVDVTSLIGKIKNGYNTKQKKLVLIDDWQKATSTLTIKGIELIENIVKLSEYVSIFIFSRPGVSYEKLKEFLNYFSQHNLCGPDYTDVESCLSEMLPREVKDEEVKIVLEVSPNVLNLIKTLEIIDEGLKSNESIHSLFSRIDKNALFELPRFNKNEFDILSLIYYLPDGLSENELDYLKVDIDIINTLISSGCVKATRYRALFYTPIHDLWREAVIRKYPIINERVLALIKELIKLNGSRYLSYISASLNTTESLCSNMFKEARELRDKYVKETDFYNVMYLAESISSSPFHSEDSIKKISDSNTAYIIANDFFQYGNIMNHTGYYHVVNGILNKSKKICESFLFDEKISDLYLLIEAELINLSYWSLNCRYLTESSIPNSTRNMSKNKRLATAIIMNRFMMGYYLLDDIDNANKVKLRASRFCLKNDVLNEKIHLNMDKAKNEIYLNPANALKLYSKSIKEYELIGNENRRLLVAKTQREALRVKLGKSKIQEYIPFIKTLKEQGYAQEYMNSMIDLATIYAVMGEQKKSISTLKAVSAHPDFATRNRLIFKVNQCQAIVCAINNQKEKSLEHWKAAFNSIKSLGRSYTRIQEHNIQQKQHSHISWCFEYTQLHSSVLYIDPRLW